jgi:hypothetical protein
MNDNNISWTPTPLHPAVQSLLAMEREPLTQPEVMKARAFSRARASLRGGLGLETVATRRLLTGSARWFVPAAAASLVLATGIAAAFQMMRKTPTKAADDRAQAAPLVSSPVPPVEPAPAVQGPATAPMGTAAKASGVPRRTGAASKPDNLREEIRLLDRARQLDVRGDYAAVLGLVAEHERAFPSGRLTEEREAVRVKALAGLGRSAEARQAAARFHRQYPRSVLSQKIDDTIATIR